MRTPLRLSTSVLLAVAAAVLAVPQLARGDGACCLPDNSCQQVASPVACAGLGGVFLEAADCANNPCGVGACCSGPSCVMATAYNCITNGREFVGAGVSCGTNPCGFETGTCCVGGACIVVLPASCASLGGTFIGFGQLCQNGPCDMGACCTESGCTQVARHECDAVGGTFFAGAECSTDPCSGPPGCPPGSLFSQPKDPPDRFTAFTSEISPGLRRYEDFDGVAGAIEALTWWGVDLRYVPPAFVECEESDPTFEISFHDDAGGVPGAAVCAYTVLATRTPTGVLYNGAELNEYTAALPASCAIVNGWVSIVGAGDVDCWFLWMSAGPGFSWCDGCAAPNESSNLSICLIGNPGGVTGACCHEESGQCASGVDISACIAPGYVFHANVACEDLAPPCGVIAGACCRRDGGCDTTTQDDCAAAGGIWLGAHTLCSQCPCVVNCPPGATAEGEPECGDGYVDTFNGGCFAETQAFSPIARGQTICGASGIFLSGLELAPDRDWYELASATAVEAQITLEAEFPVRLRIYDGRFGCASPPLIASGVALECTPIPIVAILPETAWIAVEPAGADDLAVCGARYSLRVAAPASLGDMNCDGAVDNGDIDGFVLALLDRAAYESAYPNCRYENADANSDGAVDNGDIDAFVDLLL